MKNNLYLTYKIISRHPAFIFSKSFYKNSPIINKDFYKKETKPLIKNILKNKNTLFYIHIPFCKTLCKYCYCFKEENNNEKKHLEYIEYLKKELKILFYLNNNNKLNYSWINIWWWTPNIFSDKNFKYFFRILNLYFNLKEDKEVNIDIHPSLLTKNKLRLIKENCTRVSIWIQTFNLNLIKKLNRYNNKCDLYNLYFKYFRLNKIDINVDLLIWLKWQTYKDVNSMIKKIIKLKPTNISLNYFHRKDWLEYSINKKWIKLITDIKSKWNKFILNYNSSQNTQINIESSLNNIIWIWVGAVGHIFSKISLFRNNFETYYKSLDKEILYYDKYININKYLEWVSFFIEWILFDINKKEFIKLYWEKQLKDIIKTLFSLFKKKYLIDYKGYISTNNIKDHKIIPLITELLLKNYKNNFYIENNIWENEKKQANLNYKLFFDTNGKIIDQLE